MNYAMVFPGQGSQSVGMMLAYGDAPIIRQTFDESSTALGRDLWQLAVDGSPETLAMTTNTQPLMLAAGVAVFRLWQSLGGHPPSALAGHSLGEYAALVAAGALSLGTAIRVVESRARAMQDAVPAGEGAMAAILGLDSALVVDVCRGATGTRVVEAVNFNDPMQTVIAGHRDAVERAAELAKARGAKRAIMLAVSAPFHCALMRPAAEKLAAVLSDVEIGRPHIPVINNVDVRCLTEPEEIRDALVRQAYSPVRWVETMYKMETMGITQVFECGPGKVLSGLVKRCSEGLVGSPMSDRSGLEARFATVSGDGQI